MDYMIWVWLGVIILTGLLEAATMQIASIWFVGGGLVALLTALVHAPIWLQVTLFLLVSLVLLFFTRPILVDKLKVGKNRTNADTLIGEVCIVDEPIDNIKSEGSVKVRSLTWTARSTKDEVTFKKGDRVMVADIKGVKLIVEKENK